MLPKNKYDLFFFHLFFVGFINNLKRFFCVCHKQTTKSVNVSSAEQQHNKGVTRRRQGRGRWRSGKNRRARAEFIIQLSPFPTDEAWVVCVVNLLSFFFAYFAACSRWECVLPPSISPPSLFLLYSVLGQAVLLLRSFFIFLTEHVPLIASRATEKERECVGWENHCCICAPHTHTHSGTLVFADLLNNC